MLFNPKWNTPTDRQASLGDLIQWLAQQKPDRGYDYWNPRSCLAYQYRQSLGQHYGAPIVALLAGPNFGLFSRQLEKVAYQGVHNFGAALERAERMKANTVKRWLW